MYKEQLKVSEMVSVTVNSKFIVEDEVLKLLTGVDRETIGEVVSTVKYSVVEFRLSTLSLQ